MKESAIRTMLRDLVNELDYDLAKSLDPKLAEDPEMAKEEMAKLEKIVRKHLEKDNSTPRARRAK